MKTRLNISELEPKAYEAMYALENYTSGTNLNHNLKELIKIRASQINACAYCIEMHTQAALKNGETAQRLFALSAWWESPLFTPQEKAVLKMTEEITEIAQQGLTEPTFQQVKEHFNDNEIAQIIMQINVINAWNRIAVSTHMFHSH